MSIETFQGGQSNFGVPGNTQGATPSMVALRCRYKDLDDNYADPTDPYMRILTPDSNTLVSVDTIGSVEVNGRYSVVPDPSTDGLFSFSFLPTGMDEGLYNIEWGGKFKDSQDKWHTVVIKGQIAIGEISRVQDYINRVVDRLFDDHFVDYRLDEPVRQFPDKNVYQYLRDAVGRFNAVGPRITNLNINSFPVEIGELLVTGGVIWALYARARFEKANEMQYSDVHTLNIQRADFYKSLADGMLRDWLLVIEGYKKASPPTPVGLKSQRMPFRLFRVIGMLPNYKSYFSG